MKQGESDKQSEFPTFGGFDLWTDQNGGAVQGGENSHRKTPIEKKLSFWPEEPREGNPGQLENETGIPKKRTKEGNSKLCL